jgi:RNA recognition motif-containing protein
LKLRGLPFQIKVKDI